MTGIYSKFLGRRLSRRRILKGVIGMALGTAVRDSSSACRVQMPFVADITRVCEH